MLRIRRTAPQVVERVRRSPRPSATRQVSATITVTAEVGQGSVSQEQFAEWLTHAVEYYHRFRAGWVGIGMSGTVKVPSVEAVCREE